MNITIKVAFLKDEAQEGEFRQFSVTEDDIHDDNIFMYVSRKSKDLLHGMEENKHYKLLWRDEEGDLIDFSSPEEAQLALKSVKDGTLNVFLKEIPKTKNVHEIECNECHEPVTGARYVCMVCPNYNMCVTCETAGHHIEHEVVKLVKHAIPEVMDFPTDSDGEFVPPPRFRRWMNRFARRWHKRNGYLDEANDTQKDNNGHSQAGQGVNRKRAPYVRGDGELTRRDRVLMRLRQKRQRLNEDLNDQMKNVSVSDQIPLTNCMCSTRRRGGWKRGMTQSQEVKEDTTGTNANPVIIGENTTEKAVCKRGHGRHHHGRHHHGRHHYGRRHHGRHHHGKHRREYLCEGNGKDDEVQLPHERRNKCGTRRGPFDWRQYKVQHGRRHVRHAVHCKVPESAKEAHHRGRRFGRRDVLEMTDDKTTFESSDVAGSQSEDVVTSKLEMMTLGEEKSKFQRVNRQHCKCRAPVRRHFRKSQPKPQD